MNMMLIADDFRGHKKACVGPVCDEVKTTLTLMAGGITPVAQPLDKIINKIFKGCVCLASLVYSRLFTQCTIALLIDLHTRTHEFCRYLREFYHLWMLSGFKDSSRHNPKTGYPYPPSRQLLSTWVVKSWEKIPSSLVKKAFKVCGYIDHIAPINPSQLKVALGDVDEALKVIVRNELGEKGLEMLDDPENGPHEDLVDGVFPIDEE